MNLSLLDYLQVKTKCEYLSDLPSEEYRKNIVKELKEIPFSSYSPEEWEHTVQYIVKESVKIEKKEDVFLYF